MNDPKPNDQPGSGLAAAPGSVVDTEHREKVICPHCGKSNSYFGVQRMVGLCANCGHERSLHWNGRGCCQNEEPQALSPRSHFCTCNRFKIQKPNTKSSHGHD